MAGGTIGDVHYAHQSAIKFQEYAVKGADRGPGPLHRQGQELQADRLAAAGPGRPIRSSTTRSMGSPCGGRWPGSSSTGTRTCCRRTASLSPRPNWTLDEMLTSRQAPASRPGSTDFYPVGYPWRQLRDGGGQPAPLRGGVLQGDLRGGQDVHLDCCAVPADHQLVLRQHQGRPLRPPRRGGRRSSARARWPSSWVAWPASGAPWPTPPRAASSGRSTSSPRGPPASAGASSPSTSTR